MDSDIPVELNAILENVAREGRKHHMGVVWVDLTMEKIQNGLGNVTYISFDNLTQKVGNDIASRIKSSVLDQPELSWFVHKMDTKLNVYQRKLD